MKNFNILIKVTNEENCIYDSIQSVIVKADSITHAYDYVIDEVLGTFSDDFSYTVIEIRQIFV